MNKATRVQAILNTMFYGNITSLNRNSENKFTAGLQLSEKVNLYIDVTIDGERLHLNHGITPHFNKVLILDDYSSMTLTALQQKGSILLNDLARLYSSLLQVNITNKLFVPFKE